MKYYLHNKHNDGTQDIFMRIGLGTEKTVLPDGGKKYMGKKFRYYTGQNVLPKYWDKKNQRARINYPDSDEINKHLQELRSRWTGLKLAAHREGKKLSKTDLQKAFKKGRKQESKKNLMQALKEYIELNSRIKEPGTMKKYITLEKQLAEFIADTGYVTDFDTINDVFKLKFITYLYDEYDNFDNTVERKIENLKTFLNWATLTEYNTHRHYKAFKVPVRAKTIIYLPHNEIEILEQHDFSGNQFHEQIRDMYCFGCHTGLRFSDLSTLSSEHIHSKVDNLGAPYHELQKDMVKVKKVVKFKLDNYAVLILNKYKSETGRVFPAVTNQRFNELIKEVAKAAELNSKIEIVEYQGNETRRNTFSKHEVISSHSARHSFAIRCIREGMPITYLKELLGHSDIETTMVYLSVDQDELNSAIDKYMNK